MLNIDLHPLTPASADWPEAEQLYIEAFPECERRDVKAWRTLAQAGEDFTVCGIYSGGIFCGIVTLWDFGSFCYVEHFAVQPARRGGGLGAKVLEACMQARPAVPFVLEAEPPETEMATRRIGFYTRCGFALDATPYLQPPYRRTDDWLPLCLMSTDSSFLAVRREDVKRNIYTRVYGVDMAD